MEFNILESGNLQKPTNQKLASHLGKKHKDTPYNESTVRSWKKKDEELYTAKLLEYREEKSPFLEMYDFNNLYASDIDYTKDVLAGTVPGLKIKNCDKVLVPTNLNNILESRKAIREFKTCSVVSVANYKGGVAKTTTTLNLAVTLSFYGYNVLIVDLDGQGNSTGMFNLHREKKSTKVDLTITKPEELYNLENSDYYYSLIDLLTEVENDDIEKLVKKSVINLNDKVQTSGRLDIIPNDNSLENAIKLEYLDTILTTYGNTNQVLDEILDYVKDDYDFVLIDTPPSISLPLRMSVLATDYFLIALTPDKMSKDGIAPFIAPIELNSKAYKKLKKKDITILGGIIGLYQGNTNIHKVNGALIGEDLINIIENSHLGDTKLFKQFIKRDNVITEAQSDKGVVLLYNPLHELNREFFNLADEIVESIIIDMYSKI